MLICFSIVKKYGHLQKYSLRTTGVFLVVALLPRVFSRRVKVETRAGKTGSALAG